MITGQLDIGAVEVVRTGTEEVIGYAYAVENERGQLQRWLLWSDPRNAFQVRAAPEPMASWTLAQWQANVPGLWRPGGHYVHAQTDLYRYGATHGSTVWTSIPAALPPPTYPKGGPLQLDPTGGKILDLRSLSTIRGLAYSEGGLSNPHSAEYWLLLPDYQPAGRAASVEIAIGASSAQSLADFVAAASERWAIGCVFAITGCDNYQGTAPPAYP